ncbi:MAG: HlyC/CorC family transporter [Ruminococcaceae bacterium]|nr:HlyC/CorC family transporter [Oscillospiraceae bacterium]
MLLTHNFKPKGLTKMPDDSGNKLKEAKKRDSLFSRLFGSKSREEIQQEAEEEILSLVEEGQEKGVIGDSTKNIIENVFDFDDTVASEIMTHRTEMTAIEDTSELSQVVDAAIESGYSRIPVFKGDIDTIVGVLYVKDLLPFVGAKVEGFDLSKVVRDVLFVPKTKNCSELFTEMTKKRVQMAIVVDEYGGTEGLITLEDLIEDILGNIRDEYDNEEDEVKKLSDNRFTVEGSASIEDISKELELDIPETDCDTVAGFILENLGRIPEDSETPEVTINNATFKINKIEERRILSVTIEKHNTEE